MFDLTPNLKNDVISLRPLIESDFDALFVCGGDQRVWKGHPSSDRYKKKEFEKWFLNAVDSNALTIIDYQNDKIIGSTRFYCEATPRNSIAIGYTFLSYVCWGGKTNFQLKSLMFDYAFTHFESVWMHIAPSNIRSQRATLKLGARHIKDDSVCLHGGEYKIWKFYKITREKWLNFKSH